MHYVFLQKQTACFLHHFFGIMDTKTKHKVCNITSQYTKNHCGLVSHMQNLLTCKQDALNHSSSQKSSGIMQVVLPLETAPKAPLKHRNPDPPMLQQFLSKLRSCRPWSSAALPTLQLLVSMAKAVKPCRHACAAVRRPTYLSTVWMGSGESSASRVWKKKNVIKNGRGER